MNPPHVPRKRHDAPGLVRRIRHAARPPHRLAPAALATLLALSGCATPDKPATPPPVPDSPLISAAASQPDLGATRTRRTDTPTAPTPRDLGPLHVRVKVNGKDVDGNAPTPGAAGSQNTEPVQLNFVDADLPNVVRAMARYTGRNFVVDPRVKGQLTLVSERPVDPNTAYDMLLGALRMQGVAVIDVNGVSRVVPEADAKLQGVPVAESGQPATSGGLVTRVFRLQYENATNLLPVLRPMIAPNNPINAYPNNNTLVVTDYADNMARIAKVIAEIDNPDSLSADVIPVRYGIASDIAPVVGGMLDTRGGNDPSQQVTVAADPRSNSVLVRASNPARAQLARELVMRLDNPQSQAGNLHVVYLRNAQAVKLAGVLRGALTGQSDNRGGSAAAPSGGTPGSDYGSNPFRGGTSVMNPSPSTQTQNALGTGANGANASQRFGQNGDSGDRDAQGNAFSVNGATITADPTTNTLIISAPEPLYRSLREVIDELDQRRAQVLVESLIVEVSSDDAAQFGIQWMFGGNGFNGNGSSVFGGTNLNGSGLNLSSSTATTLDALGSGLNVGLVKGTVDALGHQVINLGVLARAMQGRQGTNILSTPNLLTLDNEQASIVVGQTVPFVTGSYVTNSGDGSGNPFQTIEREDVGLTLKLRPQISEGGTVKLDLYQEVSSIDDTATSTAGIITRKRALDTSVLVDDGQIIVLGGLLEDSGTDGTQSVPILGDLPWIGSLFRYTSRHRTKTNLMIFLRPHIVRGTNDSRRLTMDRYDYMQRVQDNARTPHSWPLPDVDSPHLPTLGPDGQPLSSRTLDLRPSSADQTLSQDPPPTITDTRVHPTTPRPPAPATSMEGLPAVGGQLGAGRNDSGSQALVLQIARADSQAQAQQIVQRVSGTGLQAYTQVAPGGSGVLVRTRVARDPAAAGAAAELLTKLGYQPETIR
ncbi:type II secretion system protein GspD [Bordetella genomosp. 8]|uniref:Type II secretion system protein GspD n=1 Tax=Bordetella genomosp. 8 TaxID=1416806 RepID=A0A1W6YT23_9BORD|nr:type II secretion system secretin GspD [Bordetella genomosp. 8]ARP84161.1 type II secretion system protein GspD [Bordetella genomosp. 8]